MKRWLSNRVLCFCKWKSLQSSSSYGPPNVADCCINIFDDQLADIIFKFIPMYQWSRCLEYVSKQFRRCVLLAYCRVKFMNLKKLFSIRSMINLFSIRQSNIDYGVIQRDTAISILEKLLSVCPNLTGIAGFQYITRRMCTRSTWDILKEFHNLQSISLEHVEISFDHFADFVTGCKSLRHLTLYYCKYVGSGMLDVGSLSSVCKSWVYGNVKLENLSEKLINLTIDSFTNSFKNATDAEVAMKLCINLESLSVGIIDMENYKILFNVLPNLCKLIDLRIWGGENYLQNNALDETFCGQLDLIKNQLLTVEFTGTKIGKEILHFLLTKCSNLQRLKVYNNESLFAGDLKNVHNLPCNLKELDFPDTNGIILSLILPNLVQLSNFTDLTISGQNLTITEEWENICCLVKLKTLCVYGLSFMDEIFFKSDRFRFLNDSLLEKWDNKNDKMFENLVTLEIPRCNGISDAGGCLLAKKAKNLQILDISQSRITEKTISIFAEVAKKLTTANFAYCNDPSLDVNAFLRFIKKATCLKTLTVSADLVERIVCHKEFLQFVDYVEVKKWLC